MPESTAVTIVDRLVPLFGLAAFVALAFALSKHRRAALRRWPLIIWGLALQGLFALWVLRTDSGKLFFSTMNDVFVAIVDCSTAGSSFVFGALGLAPGTEGSITFVFAFYVLPTIIFFSSLSALLYQLGLMGKIVSGIAWVMQRTMKTSGAETLSASANIFLGQTEAPLTIRPYLPKMTNSELMAVMTGGFATIAGGVMASYVGMLGQKVPGIAGHLLAASIMSAPAGLLFAKVIVPETETPETAGAGAADPPRAYSGALDAAAGGATEGLQLALNVGAMLIAFLALMKLGDILVGSAAGAAVSAFEGKEYARLEGFDLRYVLGFYFQPLAWLMGIPWEECANAGKLLGVKTIANEFIAYADLSSGAVSLSPRSAAIMSYALCGFANVGSIGIQIGALSILAPGRRADLVKLAVPALIAGSLACFSTACFAAILM